MSGRPTKRKPRKPDYLQQERLLAARKRSSSPPLWERAWPWWTLGAILIGFPLIRDATSDRMNRGVYPNEASCRCAYSAQQCTRGDNGRYLGPWYARDAADRRPDDPGEGNRCGTARTGSGGGYYSYGGNDDVRGRTGVESGYRGGFGGSGRVRAAGS